MTVALAVIGLLLLYSGVTTFFLVRYRAKAAERDTLNESLAELERARSTEKGLHYEQNQAWQRERDEYRKLVRDLNGQYYDCMRRLREGAGGQHPATEPTEADQSK